jgi:hypothetical protein
MYKARNQEYLLLLDNSFVEEYCYGSDQDAIRARWDKVITDIIPEVPRFEDDYEIVYVSFC